jgi:hypothetical protein
MREVSVFVIIADQIDSSHHEDLVEPALGSLGSRFSETLTLPPERTAGDELQMLTTDATTALNVALSLLRGGHFRVGVGVGPVQTPLPASVREARGAAFVAARAAVEAAAKNSHRWALRGAQDEPGLSAEVGVLVELLLAQRARWSPHGWELYDLLATGATQADAAQRLGITPQAASKRARAAGLRLDADARVALARLLANVNRPSRGNG